MVHFGPFQSNSVQFGPFRAVSGESWGVGWGRGGIRETGFCKGKEDHNALIHLVRHLGPFKLLRDRKSTPKKLCDKNFAEFSGEFSGEICLKALVLLDRPFELFRKCFGAVRAIFLHWGFFFLALD